MKQAELLDLIDECRRRGVVAFKLPDGHEVHIHPTAVVDTPPGRGPKAAVDLGEVLGAPAADTRDAWLNELDKDLFGEVLESDGE